jgi:4-amino-4-deoxy-L-arabinose transferase-like glycosyltransferase
LSASENDVLRDRRLSILTWVAVLAPSVLLRTYPPVPLAADEKVFAVVSRELAAGAMLYRDVFDHKGPALYWIINLWQWLAGGSYVGVRVGLMAVAVVLQVSVFLIVRRVTGSRRAAFATALAIGLAAWLTNRIFGVELLLTSSIAAALAFLVCSRGWAGALAAGILGGLALMVKPIAALPLAVLCYLAWRQPGRRPTPARAAALAGGTAVVSLAFLWPFLTSGLMGEVVNALWRFNSYYSNIYPLTPEQLRLLGAWLTRQFVLCAFLWLPAVAMMRKTSRESAEARSWALGLLLWAGLEFAIALLGRRPFNHYLLPAYLPMSILLGLWLARVRLPALAPRIPAFLAAVAAWLVILAAAGYWHTTYARASELAYAAAEQRIARQVDRLTSGGESVYVWGNATNVYYFSARPPATRYIYYPPFRGAYGKDASGFEQAYWRDWTHRFDIARPAVVVDCSRIRWNDLPWLDPYRNPELAVRLARDYREIPAPDGFRIYRREPDRRAEAN